MTPDVIVVCCEGVISCSRIKRLAQAVCMLPPTNILHTRNIQTDMLSQVSRLEMMWVATITSTTTLLPNVSARAPAIIIATQMPSM